MPILSERDKLGQKIMSRFNKASKDLGLIEDGDHLLVGVSGGNDSLCLLEMVGRRMRIHRPSFTADAVHIRMENIKYETDTAYVSDFAARYNIPLHVVATSFEPRAGSRKSPCFLCSWNRRKQMFTLAQRLGCNKIALGHHSDDIIHTTLMNLLYQGHFSTMPARLQMRKMPLAIIRPLCLTAEADIKAYASMRGYEAQVRRCPYEDASRRTDARQLFTHIEELAPEARFSILNALREDGKLTE